MRPESSPHDDPVNEPGEIVYCINFAVPGGGESRFLDAAEFADFNTDPDAFAAKETGCVDTAEYREWVRSNGTPLCAAKTRRGRLCKCGVDGIGCQKGVEFWRAHHRNGYCHTHA